MVVVVLRRTGVVVILRLGHGLGVSLIIALRKFGLVSITGEDERVGQDVVGGSGRDE